ncbi:MAG TPA: divergent polysaccharide deacetylase family protein [Caulobacteraceae bacterium]
MRNRYVRIGGASGLFVSAVLGLIAIGGDPAAGAPVVRIALLGPGAPTAPAGWRAALSPEPVDPTVTMDTLHLHEDVDMVGVEPMEAGAAGGGEAVLTLPGGGQLLEDGGGDALRVYAGEPLVKAPIAGLTAAGSTGLLPVVGPDGRTPAQAYARPFKDNGKPKIALVIGGLGLNAASTRKAIENLPPEVTLSFVPYAEGLQAWIDLARANGHEVLLEIPMEPMDYPENDPGPYTLLAQGQPEDVNKRLEWLLSRAQGYFGVTNYLGGRFLASDVAVGVFTGAVKRRGLAFLDDGQAAKVQSAGLPRASADRVVDDQLSGDAIGHQLLALEAEAKERGHAMGSGFAYPVTVQQVSRWAESLSQRGYQLAPASAMTRR